MTAHIPHGRTARRLLWEHLPPLVRTEVEMRCGSPVVEAVSQDAGFTPGFASVLTCADGSRHFVKGASVVALQAFAEAYREEGRKASALPAAAPAPALRWRTEYDDWVLLCFEAIEARAPSRPWRPADLEAAMTMTTRIAETLTPAPARCTVSTFAVEFAGFPDHWRHLARAHPDQRHLPEAAELAAGFGQVTAGGSVVHTDIRDDNILITPTGEALLCDWNWPVIGAAWIDTVLLMIGPRGDGLDVEAALAGHPLTRDVPREHVDRLLALVLGYFWRSSEQPVPHNSPYVRDAQGWQADVCWEWLAERRGWDLGG